MTLMSTTRIFAIVSTFVCASAAAQTRFCIGGDLDHLTQAQKSACSAKMQAVKAAAAGLHAPEDWHFVVVCGENGWKSYAAYAMDENASLLNASADTNLEQHETFLREDKLDLANLHSVRRVVAHEVAGIAVHSKDEVAIHQQMKLWFGESPAHTGF